MRPTGSIVLILSGLALLFAATPASAGPEDLAKKGGNAIAQKFGFGSPFGRHPQVIPFQVEGRWVYILELRDCDGSRCTNNFGAKWDGKKRFRAYICNVPRGIRMLMSFQRKGDKKLGEDSNRGEPFRHKSSVVIDGTNNYLAERGFNYGVVQSDCPLAFVMLVEEGLSDEKVYEYFESKNDS